MDAITFFLTYSRTDGTEDDLYSHLNSIKSLVWARICVEAHQDGSPHLHAVFRTQKRVKTSGTSSLWDWNGQHPNIQVPRKIKDVLEYLSKTGNFKDYGPVPAPKVSIDDLYKLAEGHDRDAFDKCALEMRISYQWANHIWNRNRCTNNILEPGQGIECVQLQSLPFDNKSTLVIGPSGCGKSSWAKRVAPKPALFVSHMDDLKKFCDHKCIIFDDMNFTHLPREAQIHIVDQHDVRTLHCRHTTATIPANTPKIFTANEMCFLDDDAIKRRLRIIKISSFP